MVTEVADDQLSVGIELIPQGVRKTTAHLGIAAGRVLNPEVEADVPGFVGDVFGRAVEEVQPPKHHGVTIEVII